MKTLIAVLVIAFALPGFAASKKAARRAEQKDDLQLIHVSDLEKMMADKNSATYIFDANNEKTRKEYGVIPGAKTLESSHAFDTKVLPADKNANLVFYCANTMCMASHEAAKKAKAEGYTHTMVMADGIQGWKKAGKPTEPVAKD